MPRNTAANPTSGLSLLEILVVLAMISGALAIAMPNLSFDQKRQIPELVQYLKEQRSESILKGKSNRVYIKNNSLKSSLTDTELKLEKTDDLRLTYPAPSEFMPHQDVALFYADGTAIVSEFAVARKDVEGTPQILYNVSINPFDSTILYYAP